MRLEAETGLDVGVLEAVLECGQPEARIALARQLAALIADPETSLREREQVLPIMLKIATDTDRNVRRALADELVTLETLNADLVFAVIADEDAIAIPFLSATPALNPWHMLAILRVGDDARQSSVARRADLTVEAKSYILKAGTLAAALAMLVNPAVKLLPVDLQQLYQRLGQSGEMVERLLARPDLPLDVRITQAKRAAVRMRQLMAERGWLPANDAAELVADAEETAVLQVLSDAETQERLHATAFLAAQHMLTPSLIIRAACVGEMRVVATALAHLTGHAPGRVEELIKSKGGNGIKSLINRSGLPLASHVILTAASQVMAELRSEGISLDADGFGRRLLETLMMHSGALPHKEQVKQIDFIGRYGDEKVRKIARKLKADLLRAA